MWFASIWIFTLGLPWQKGAEFFMKHLLDGDAASNTLSWRWVGGLQTKGKHYLAQSWNISKFLNKHPYLKVEKYIQEIYWRIYWKGWLELRPEVWSDFVEDLNIIEESENYY